MSRNAFEVLIEEDIKWLENMMAEHNPHSLEGKHIINCLQKMPELMYDYYYKKA